MAVSATLSSLGDTSILLYVGTHRRAHRADAQDIAFGIYGFRLDVDGAWQPCGLTETQQPGWIAASPSGDWLYAVNEVRSMDGREGGAVSAFAVDRQSGALRPINSRPLPPMPCHCVVDATGRNLLVATFGGGSVHLFRLESDGAIGDEADCHIHSGSSAHPRRQTAPHAHAVVISPDNRFVLVPDLGTDRLVVYALDADADRLIPQDDLTVALPPLSGPRHAAFSPSGRHLYLINEMSAAIGVFGWDAATGRLDLRQTVDLLPEHFVGLRSGAAIAVHPNGHHLYATTRSHGSSGMPEQPGQDNLCWFAVDPASGLLQPGGRLPSGGGIPRSFALSRNASCLLVGHQCSGTIVEFDLADGIPVASGRSFAVPVPVCLVLAE